MSVNMLECIQPDTNMQARAGIRMNFPNEDEKNTIALSEGIRKRGCIAALAWRLARAILRRAGRQGVPAKVSL
jgi:hypothetical protein